MSMGGGGKSAAKQPKKLGGIDFTGAQYGACLTVVFGKNKVAGNVGWYGDFRAIPHKEKQPGKGGGAKSNTTFTYSASFQIMICEGVASVAQVYDSGTPKSLATVGGIAFTGTTPQTPWAHLTGDAALAYAGTSLVAFQDVDLGSNASLPNYTFEMNGLNQFGGGIDDANPADIVTTIATDPCVGINFSALGDLTAYSNYCRAAGLFMSPVYDQQQSVVQIFDDLFKFTNSAPWFSEGKLKIKPYGDSVLTGNGATYTPELTPVADLTANDFLTNGPSPPVKVRRKSIADAQNMVRLEYKDRSNNYRTIPVQASIDQDLVANGVRALQNESADMITTGAVARQVCQNLLQRRFYVRNTYEFRLAWRWCFLEPMDVVTLTDADTGLYLDPVRIIDVTEDEYGTLQVVAEELPDGIGHGGAYPTQPNVPANVDPNIDPGPITAPYLFRAPGFLVSAGAPQIWCAVASQSQWWGGCDVYISHDGTSYTYLKTHIGEASYGYITNAIAAGADLDNSNTPNVVLNGNQTLVGGTADDRDEFITLSMLDTELFSYRTATLAAGPSYNLSSLRRGGYGTTNVSHAINAPFVRLDDNIIKIPIDASRIGSTVYLKFRSFNVFGQGNRDLASETAYSYVVGSNVEFPDVPVVPSSFAAIGVADGVNLSWNNPNPAAVACTSIEYATSGGGPWTVLAQVGPTTTGYQHAFTGGGTYYYRARSRGHQISGGWSAYTSTLNASAVDVSAIKTNVDATSDDNKISPAEKPSLIIDYNTLTGEQSGLDAQATAFGITTEKTAYDNAVTALTAYMATLTSPVLWSNKTNYTTVVGSTMRSKFQDVFTARTALVSKLSAVAKSIADGKILYFRQTTTPTTTVVGSLWFNPNTGVTQSWDGTSWVISGASSPTGGNGENLLPNCKFFDNFSGGGVNNTAVASGSALCDGWYTTVVPGRADCIVRWLSSGSIRLTFLGALPLAKGSTIVLVGATRRAVPVDPNRTYLFSFTTAGNAYDGTLPGGVTLTARITVRWYDSTGAQISYNQACTRDRTDGSASGTLTAPANAMTAEVAVELRCNNATGSAWTHSGSIAADIRFSAVSMVKVADLDSEIQDGTNYGRLHNNDLFSSGGFNRLGLRFGASGHRLGDSRNLQQITVGGGVAQVPTVITYSATAGTPATATISVAAWTMTCGSVSVAYGAKTVGVTGTNGSAVTYYLYLDDPTFSGTGTLVATTTGTNVYANDGRVYIGSCLVNFPTLGGGSGGGSGGGKGGPYMP